MSEGIIVVTSKNCYKCPAFKEEIHKLEGVSVEFVDEDRSDFMTICKKYDLTEAPVAILFDDDNNILYKGGDIEELKSNL